MENIQDIACHINLVFCGSEELIKAFLEISRRRRLRPDIIRSHIHRMDEMFSCSRPFCNYYLHGEPLWLRNQPYALWAKIKGVQKCVGRKVIFFYFNNLFVLYFSLNPSKL